MTTLSDKLRAVTAKYQRQIDALRKMKHDNAITPSACEQMVDRLKTLADREKEEIMSKR